MNRMNQKTNPITAVSASAIQNGPGLKMVFRLPASMKKALEGRIFNEPAAERVAIRFGRKGPVRYAPLEAVFPGSFSLSVGGALVPSKTSKDGTFCQLYSLMDDGPGGIGDFRWVRAQDFAVLQQVLESRRPSKPDPGPSHSKMAVSVEFKLPPPELGGPCMLG